MTAGDADMNDMILSRLGRVPSRGSIAKAAFEREGLKGIAGEEKEAIQQELLSNWSSREDFIQAMAGKFDRSDAQWCALFDNERHLADEASQMVVEARLGKTTKSWVLGDSESGPCPECQALADDPDNQDVPIGEPYSTGDTICSAHPGCVCQSQFSKVKD